MLTFQSQAETPSPEGLSEELEASPVRQQGAERHARHVQISSAMLHVRLRLADREQLGHLPHVWAPGIGVGIQISFLLIGQHLQGRKLQHSSERLDFQILLKHLKQQYSSTTPTTHTIWQRTRVQLHNGAQSCKGCGPPHPQC